MVSSLKMKTTKRTIEIRLRLKQQPKIKTEFTVKIKYSIKFKEVYLQKFKMKYKNHLF